MTDLVTGIDLGPEFDQGIIQSNKIRLKLGSGLAIQLDGTIVTDLTLNVTKQPVYETHMIWAEESGGVNANNAEWSYGNGATGFIGLPLSDGWEITEMGFNADVYSAGATISIDAMNYATPSNAAGNTLSTISLTSETDGGGATNNPKKVVTYGTPIPIPSGAILGFITRTATGTISDLRVWVKIRRSLGDFVTDVTLT